MGLPRYTTALMPAFLLLCCLHVGKVHSFVSFLPTSTEQDSAAEGFDDTFDQQTLQSVASDDKLLFRLLYNVILEKLHNIDQSENTDFVPGSSEAAAYRAIKRGIPGLERMSKRKVFWQPIGFLPNKGGASAGHGNTQGQAASQNQHGQPFRYG